MRNGKDHKCSATRCGHASVRVMRVTLQSVFLRGRLPAHLSNRDRELVLGKLVEARRNGNGSARYDLTAKGRQVLIDLIDPI